MSKYDLVIPTPEDEIVYFCKNKKIFLKYPILMSYEENIVIPAQKDKEI